MKLFNRDPFRKRPLVDFLEWLDDTNRGGKYLIIVAIIFEAAMLWLCLPILNEDEEPLNRHVKVNEHTGQYYRDITY